MCFNLTQKFIDIPAADLKIGLADKAVLLVLARHADQSGSSCFPSQVTIAAKVGCDVRTVKRCVKRLEAAGLIRRVARGRKGTAYLVSVPSTPPPARANSGKGDSVSPALVTESPPKKPMIKSGRVAGATNRDSNSKVKGPTRPKSVAMPACWRSARWSGNWYPIFRQEGAGVAFEIVHQDFVQMCRRKGISLDGAIIERSWRGFCRSRAA